MTNFKILHLYKTTPKNNMPLILKHYTMKKKNSITSLKIFDDFFHISN